MQIEQAIEPRLAPDGDLGDIADWGGKLAGAILRIAALLHLAGHPDALRTPIPAETLDRARRIGEFFTEHAVAAFACLGQRSEANPEVIYLRDHLLRHGAEEFTIRSLLTALPRGRFPTSETVIEALTVEEHGWIIRRPDPPRTGPGRKPSPRYELHPDAATYAETA